MHIRPTDPYFQEILLKYAQESDPARRKEAENTIWQKYGTECTAFVLDMSSFSLLTRKYGIVHYLAMIRRMQLTVQPIITDHGGMVVKFEADNCFASFPEPASAVRAATTTQHAIAAANLITPDDMDIHVSIGIDYGKTLVLEDDMFGEAVNRACKLGEDIGRANEILITKEASELIPDTSQFQRKPIEVSIGGVNFQAFQVVYQKLKR